MSNSQNLSNLCKSDSVVYKCSTEKIFEISKNARKALVAGSLTILISLH